MYVYAGQVNEGIQELEGALKCKWVAAEALAALNKVYNVRTHMRLKAQTHIAGIEHHRYARSAYAGDAGEHAQKAAL